MQTQQKLPFFTLLLMISFASVNAVLFTPGLPDLALYFGVTNEIAQQTITYYLIGYALGQLVYGPFANRYGRKPALYLGIIMQIIFSLICIYASVIQSFLLMIIGRLFLALGAGVGLKITFTMMSESYEPKIASQKIAYLMLGFAIAPGFAVALGGVLNTQFGWQSCFYAGSLYGILLIALVRRLPETLLSENKNLDALKLPHLLKSYWSVLKNSGLNYGGLLIGSATCFVYLFAAITPFVAMTIYGMTSESYGLVNMLPPIGMILGSLTSARLSKKYKLGNVIKSGVIIAGIGTLLMLAMIMMHCSVVNSIFLPMIIIYFGLSFIMANVSVMALSLVTDKSNGSAMMNFINIGLAILVIYGVGYLPVTTVLLPAVYLALSFFMIYLCKKLLKQATN